MPVGRNDRPATVLGQSGGAMTSALLDPQVRGLRNRFTLVKVCQFKP
jgi:hypothetical protein